MKVLIVGGGIGGLTLGAFLEDSSIEYEIVEKAQDFNWNNQGFLIGIWDNGRSILKKLGLSDVFDVAGQPMHKYSIRNGKGDIIREYSFSEFYVKYGGALRLIERAALHEWLLKKVGPQKITMGTTVSNIVQKPDGVAVTFNNGSTKEYDLVVGADGIHSSVRNLVFGKNFECFENWRVWCVWMDTAVDTPATFTEYVEASELGVIQSIGTKAMAWLMAPADHTTWDTVEGRKERLKKIFKHEVAFMPKLLEKVQDSEIQPSDLLHFRLAKWSVGRVTLLGDAAHSLGPYAGVGGSMAMEDAYVLASELLRVGEALPLSKALHQYEKRRKKRIKAIWNLSRRLRRFLMIKSRILRKFFDFCMPYLPSFVLTHSYDDLMKERM